MGNLDSKVLLSENCSPPLLLLGVELQQERRHLLLGLPCACLPVIFQN